MKFIKEKLTYRQVWRIYFLYICKHRQDFIEKYATGVAKGKFGLVGGKFKEECLNVDIIIKELNFNGFKNKEIAKTDKILNKKINVKKSEIAGIKVKMSEIHTRINSHDFQNQSKEYEILRDKLEVANKELDILEEKNK